MKIVKKNHWCGKGAAVSSTKAGMTEENKPKKIGMRQPIDSLNAVEKVIATAMLDFSTVLQSDPRRDIVEYIYSELKRHGLLRDAL